MPAFLCWITHFFSLCRAGCKSRYDLLRDLVVRPISWCDQPASPDGLGVDHVAIGPRFLFRPQDLKNEPLLLISENRLMRKRPFQTFESESVKTNLILDQLTAEAYADHDIVIRPFTPIVPTELKLVLPTEQALSKPARALVAIAKSHMRQSQSG